MNSLRRPPVERSPRKIIILPLPCSKLFLKVGKGIKLVGSIESLMILSVTMFHLAIVPWGQTEYAAFFPGQTEKEAIAAYSRQRPLVLTLYSSHFPRGMN